MAGKGIQVLQMVQKHRGFSERVSLWFFFLSIENMPLIKLVLPPYILNNFNKMIQFGLRKNLYFTYDITHIGTYGDDIVNVFLTYFETGD